MSEAKTGIVREFTEHGRTVTGVHDVTVREDSGFLGSLIGFTGGTLSADRYEIVTAAGPLGPECIVIPFDGHSVLPGEYHLTLAGALRSPVEFVRGLGGKWHAGPDIELAKWLKAQKFPTWLPDELKQGFTKMKIEQILQLFPIGPQHSALVFTLGGNHAMVNLTPYVELVEKLGPAIGASVGPGPLAPLGQIRYAALVAAAHAGELDVQPDPAAPAAAAVDAPARLIAALTPLLDNRVLLAPIDDKPLGNILKKVAKGRSGDAVLAFLDTGARASGKAGWAFTADTLIISQIGDNWEIPFASIRSFERTKKKVVIDAQMTGAITCDVYDVADAVVPALEAVTGLPAT